LLLLLDTIFHAADSGKSSLLVSLDLSAAFDSIDHSVLLDRLSHSFGVTDMALSWIQSYLTDRSYSVRLGQCSSPTVSCRAGVPQGSVLGPLLFAAFCTPISALCHLYDVQQQQYTDDTQLDIAISPSDPRTELNALHTCLT